MGRYQVHRIRPSGFPHIGDERFRLSSNDMQHGHPVYVPVCLFLKVPEGERKSVADQLMRGLEETLDQVRFLAGTIEKDEGGDYYILSRRESTVTFIQHFVDEDSKSKAQYPSYEALEANNFLIPTLDNVAALRVQTLPCCRVSTDPNTSPPVIGIQANFILGGLAIAVHFNHWAMDYAGYAAFIHQWSENTRALAGGTQLPTLDPFCLDRSRLTRYYHFSAESPTRAENGINKHNRINAEERVVNGNHAANGNHAVNGNNAVNGNHAVNEEYEGRDSQLGSDNPSAAEKFRGATREKPVDCTRPKENVASVGLFHLTKSKADKLKLHLTANNGPWISTYDACVAVWWRILTKHRSTLYNIDLDAAAPFAETVNTRGKMVPPLPDRYFGNAVTIATSNKLPQQLTFKDIIDAVPLSTVAAYVRSVTNTVDSQSIFRHLDAIEYRRKHNIPATKPNSGIPLAFMTNDWRALNVYTADFGFAKPTGFCHLLGAMPAFVMLPALPANDLQEEIFQFIVPMDTSLKNTVLADADLIRWFEYKGFLAE